MAKQPDITQVNSLDGITTAINTNFNNVASAFDNTLSRDGSTPNNMEADIDLDSNDLLNAGLVQTSSLIIDGTLVGSTYTNARVNSTIVVNVPTNYNTVQEALEAYSGLNLKEGATVVINIESGHTLSAISLEGGDFSKFILQSEDNTVNLDASFDNNDNIASFKDCIAPVWNILVDAEGGGRNGIFSDNSQGVVKPGKGVINVNTDSSGDGVADYGDNPNASGLFAYASKWVCEDTRWNGTDPIEADTVVSGSFVVGRYYKIVSAADTDFTLIGSSDNLAGTIFRASGVGAGSGTAVEVFYGARFSGCAERGLTATNASIVKANYVEVINTGTINTIAAGHAALWASRGSTIHANHANATGSFRGVRNLRSFVSCRDSFFDRISGTAIWTTEGGTTTASECEFSYSGEDNYPVLYLGGPTPSDDTVPETVGQPQGGGSIYAERGSFRWVRGTVAKGDSVGFINIDSNSAGADCKKRVAEALNGCVISCVGGNFRGSDDVATDGDGVLIGQNTSNEALYAAFGGEILARNFSFDSQDFGVGGVAYAANATLGGVIKAGGLNCFDVTPITISGGGKIYVKDLNLDNTGEVLTSGVWLFEGCSLASREDAVDAVGVGFIGIDGQTFTAEDLLYSFDSGAGDPIQDMPGVAPAGDFVYVEHFQNNTTPGSTNMRDAVSLADQYAFTNNLPLRTKSLCAVGDRLNLDTHDVKLDVKLLADYYTQGYTGDDAFVLRYGSDALRDSPPNWDITIDGDNLHGTIRQGWDASTGSFPARYFTLPGGSASAGAVAATGAVNGSWYRIHSTGTTDFTTIGAADSKIGTIFQATGAGTGTGTLSLLAANSFAVDDLIVCGVAGTVDGYAYEVGDRLLAATASPSTTTYAGNWTRQDVVTAVQVKDCASPHATFRVKGTNCDRVFEALDNTERLTAHVSGVDCITIVEEDGDNGAGDTTDSNTFVIGGSSCAQWYVCNETAVSMVELNTQSSLAETWHVPCVYDVGGRTRKYSGIMRTNHSPFIVDGDTTSSNVDFDLHFEAPGSSDIQIGGIANPLTVDNVLFATGKVTFKSPISGPWFKGVSGAGAGLGVTVYNPSQGTALTLGSTAGTKTFKGGNVDLALPDGGGSSIIAIDGQRVENSRVSYHGENRNVQHTAGTGTKYELPVGLVSGGKVVTLTAGNPDVEFVGRATLATFTGYGSSALGMRGHLSDQKRNPVFYDGTNWVQAAAFRSTSWTPGVTDGSGNAVTLSSAEGQYSRVGNVVTCFGRVVASSLGSASGALRITGLPFAASSASGAYGGGSVHLATGLAISASENVTLHVAPGNSYADMQLWDGTAGTSGFVATEMTASGQLRFSLTYIAA